MDLENCRGYTLSGLGTVNVLLGKNGCGKSTVLREVEQALHGRGGYHVRYITPERGGHLQYQAGQAQRIRQNPNRLHSDRRSNQFSNFREQSVAEYSRLELLTLRKLEQSEELRQSDYSFDTVVDQINDLLQHIQVTRANVGFEIRAPDSDEEISPQQISSGESELISLAIEALVFGQDADNDGSSILFLDEPDLHLHPDLQNRFAGFIHDLAAEQGFSVVIATHSTALVGGFREREGLNVAFMRRGDSEMEFRPVDEIHRKTIPIFGAHPLSEVYASRPILLVEGEDDWRIWQQAVRSSDGSISVHPCEVGGVSNLSDFEREVDDLIGAVYDDAVAYSLRDRDDAAEALDDLEHVKRFRLSCRSAENLILTQETLEVLGLTWDELVSKLEEWLAGNGKHSRYDEMKAFKESGYDRRIHNLKNLRNVIVGITGTSKPWEVVVGQAIASASVEDLPEHSIADYLGEDVAEALLQG